MSNLTESILALLVAVTFIVLCVTLSNNNLKEKKGLVGTIGAVFAIVSLYSVYHIINGLIVKGKLAKIGPELAKSPTTWIIILALAVFLIALIRISKVKLDTKKITIIAVCVAIAVVLDIIKLYRMPNGGSITMGSMLPIILLAYGYGAEIGYIGGLVFGILSLIISPTILHPVQVLLDYPLPYMAIGIAGYFKNNKYLGVLIAVSVRYLCHILSGVVFFTEYAGDQNPIVYSIIYNGTYLIPDLIICLILIGILPFDRIIKEMKKA
jgi:thiamine transporter